MRSIVLPLVAAALLPLPTPSHAQGAPVDPPALTEAEALALIEKSPEELARLLASKINRDDAPNAIEAQEAVERAIGAGIEAVRKDVPFIDDGVAVPFSHDLDIVPPGDAEFVRMQNADHARRLGLDVEAWRRLPARLTEAIEAAGADDALQGLVHARGWKEDIDHVRPWDVGSAKFLQGSRLNRHGWLAFRIREAVSEGDGESVIRRTEQALAYSANVAGQLPSIFGLIQGALLGPSVCEDGIHIALQAGSLDRQECAALIDALRAINFRQTAVTAIDRQLVVDALTVRRFYDIEAEARAGGFDSRSMYLDDYLPNVWLNLERRFGWRPIEAEWEVFLESWRVCRDLALIDPSQRLPDRELLEPYPRLAADVDELYTSTWLAAHGWSGNLRFLHYLHAARCIQGATLIMLALEMHRLDHGDHPESLEALVPAYLATLPVDPFSAFGFRYQRVDGVAPGPMRGYTLYSVGADETDNGGIVDPEIGPTALSGPRPFDLGHGTDQVFNWPRPWNFIGADQ